MCEESFQGFGNAFLRKGYKKKEIGFTIALVAAIYPLISYLKYKNIDND